MIIDWLITFTKQDLIICTNALADLTVQSHGTGMFKIFIFCTRSGLVDSQTVRKASLCIGVIY